MVKLFGVLLVIAIGTALVDRHHRRHRTFQHNGRRVPVISRELH